jgi:membrane protein YqaA with SNARE-associated domain
MRGWGEAFDRKRIGGFADARRRTPGRAGALRLADCNQLPRDCWVLLVAGLLVPGLCVLCVLCGSFLLLLLKLLKQNNHREHREH